MLIAVGLNIVYLDRIFFDAEVFAARAAQSLEDPRVAAFVAERIVDQAITQKRDLTGVLFQINHWIETTPTPKPSNAEIVNAREFLLARARQCRKQRGRLPNILAVDFALTGDVVGAAAELNGLR